MLCGKATNRCLVTRHVEKWRIEKGYIFCQKVAALDIDLQILLSHISFDRDVTYSAVPRMVWVVKRVTVPSRFGYLAPCFPAFKYHFPQLFNVTGISGPSESHANNGNRH